jgi:hypothetical protein
MDPTPPKGPADSAVYVAQREQMVALQLAKRDIHDERVLAAMAAVPRHVFVPAEVRASAYADQALPIGNGQTISQPYVVALMSQLLALKGSERVLEIGTGSGYQAAVLSRLADSVYSIEIDAELAQRASTTLASLGCSNVHVRAGDGYFGWPRRRRSTPSSSPPRRRACPRRCSINCARAAASWRRSSAPAARSSPWGSSTATGCSGRPTAPCASCR